MPTLHARTEILLGAEALPKLKQYHVMVAGIGGVGGYVVENLARAGIGEITLLDKDVVSPSNINRQIVALHSTIGLSKTEVMKSRVEDIDPSVKVNIIDAFMSAETAKDMVLSGNYDFIADCIDTLACKAQLIYEAQQNNIPIISAMGAGNRIDASRVVVKSLKKTHGCPVARTMRNRLKALGGNLNYPVVYSDEPMRTPVAQKVTKNGSYSEKATNGTVSYMPAIIGILVAGEMIKQMIEQIEC